MVGGSPSPSQPEGDPFPALPAEQVHERVAARWDLSGPAPVPYPGWMACPVCRCEQIQIRWWKWHVRPPKATVPWRCDVSIKCTDCSALWTHGIPVPEDVFSRCARNLRRTVAWRDVKGW